MEMMYVMYMDGNKVVNRTQLHSYYKRLFANVADTFSFEQWLDECIDNGSIGYAN